MVTKEQALGNARYFHVGECKMSLGPRGGLRVKVTAFRRNGKTKLWAKQPERFSFPVKHGFYGPHYHITELNAHLWHVESECPVMSKL